MLNVHKSNVNLINKSTWGLLKCFFSILLLSGCNDDQKGVSFKNRLPEVSALDYPSPAIDPGSLTSEEQALFVKLSPRLQNIFSELTPKQRAWAIDLTKPRDKHEAILMAEDQTIQELPLEQQQFYGQLNSKMKLRFLVLDDGPSDDAVKLSSTMDPNQAVDEATAFEITLYPEDQKKFFDKLSTNVKTLFLTLTENSQIKAFLKAKPGQLDESVIASSTKDIQRLPEDEQDFLKGLSQEDILLFLTLPPETRQLALLVTKKLELNLAMQYAASIQTDETVTEK